MAIEFLKPSAQQARDFAKLLETGAPAEHIIAFLLPELDDPSIPELAKRWMKDRTVKAARFDLLGWQQMPLEEKARAGLNRTYAAIAYHHKFAKPYTEQETSERSKTDTTIPVLERFLAGTAGRGDATSRFFEDVLAGKIKLNQPEQVQ
jgi:hypothetical protein